MNQRAVVLLQTAPQKGSFQEVDLLLLCLLINHHRSEMWALIWLSLHGVSTAQSHTWHASQLVDRPVNPVSPFPLNCKARYELTAEEEPQLTSLRPSPEAAPCGRLTHCEAKAGTGRVAPHSLLGTDGVVGWDTPGHRDTAVGQTDVGSSSSFTSYQHMIWIRHPVFQNLHFSFCDMGTK